jgi:predicted nucleotidyltransferase
VLAEEALRRQRIFRNLDRHLHEIHRLVERLDPRARVYVFGSWTEGRHTYSSDIDVLVLTRVAPAQVQAALWRAGIRDPFELHVQPPERLPLYRRRALVPVRPSSTQSAHVGGRATGS